MNDAMLLCQYEYNPPASAYGLPVPRADCCPSGPEWRILLLLPCADVTKRDDSAIRIRHAERPADRSTIVSVAPTFKSP